jgi:hypothetical protein
MSEKKTKQKVINDKGKGKTAKSKTAKSKTKVKDIIEQPDNVPSKEILLSNNDDVPETSNVIKIDQDSEASIEENKTKMSSIINTNTGTPDKFTSNILSLKKVTTIQRLTKFEKARIIGTRASQIQNGMSPVFLKDGKQVDLPEEFKDVIKSSIDVAKLELKLKSCPLIIKRTLPVGKVINITIQELD